jgi:hypothetical protein
MNIATWKSLSDADQKNWDSVTEDGKSRDPRLHCSTGGDPAQGTHLTDNAVLELMNPMPRSM